jgi:PAS domain S-box-containing protein
MVVLYQLGVAQYLERNFGPLVHYGFEIGFYSLVGPVATLLTLIWVERKLLQQEHLERQVHARTQQLASLTAISADAILSLDDHGQITSWNDGAEKMLSYREDSIIGRPLEQLLPEAETLALRLRENGIVTEFETTAIAENGQILTVELTQTQLVEAGERSTASLIIMRDVTVRSEIRTIREDERARIARDLHDGVAQTLYFMALKADMMRRQLTQGADTVDVELREIGQMTRRVIREVRRTIFALRPLNWSTSDFAKALTQFVEEYSEQAGWRADIAIDAEGSSIPSRIEPTVFRLVQESLNNAAKHAEASNVLVSISRVEGASGLRLTVSDDGCGFEPERANTTGLGLDQMRERVKAVGGTLQLTSQPGHGTTVTAQFPVPGPIPGGEG